MSRRAFTLIELLVMLAVFFTLAAMIKLVAHNGADALHQQAIIDRHAEIVAARNAQAQAVALPAEQPAPAPADPPLPSAPLPEMTRREQFALAAMQARLNEVGGSWTSNPTYYAREAWACADAMLATEGPRR